MYSFSRYFYSKQLIIEYNRSTLKHPKYNIVHFTFWYTFIWFIFQGQLKNKPILPLPVLWCHLRVSVPLVKWILQQIFYPGSWQQVTFEFFRDSNTDSFSNHYLSETLAALQSETPSLCLNSNLCMMRVLKEWKKNVIGLHHFASWNKPV